MIVGFIQSQPPNELGLEGVPSFEELLKFIPLLGIPVTFISRDWLGVICMFLELILVLAGLNRTVKLVLCLILFVIAGFSAGGNLDKSEANGFSLAISAAGAIFCFIALVA